MNTIAYCSPFVPPEWIAAHGMRPRWLQLHKSAATDGISAHRGVCPVAGALFDAINISTPAAAAVLTTTCDQIRYVAALLEYDGKSPVFLMHVPRTWQTSSSRELYRDELLRLGRFLLDCGGKAPTTELLRQTMMRYDQSRAELPHTCSRLPAQEFIEAVVRVRGDLSGTPAWTEGKTNNGRIPLALVGGTMLEGELLYLTIQNAGGRVALDATEAGPRTLPARFDPVQLNTNPIEELVRAYFDAIPDVFRRPNDRFYEWLWPRIALHGVRGMIVRRYIWCDLWHVELARLRQESTVPVLEWDSTGDDRGAQAGAPSKLEAFLEMLR
jgi:benzoyl-CoA reductase/2-hydroxyglutaryl-CoA dehydratase subunit BcrC/BadD/HgdB